MTANIFRPRVFDPGARIIRTGFFQSVLSFIFKGLIGPRKSARTQGPARHAYGGETLTLSRKAARTTAIAIRFRSLRASNRAKPEPRLHCPTEPVGSRRPTRSRVFSASPDVARSSGAA